jgi:ATP-dependent Clp protease ATP-binding subunit ClpC
MLCSRCKKRIAVVFLSKADGSEIKNEGICLKCAKELGLPQVNQMMESMGLTDEDVENMSEQLMELSEGENFELGGAGTMPSFLQSIFGDKDPLNAKTQEQHNSNNTKKEEEPKKRKFLDSYSTNLNQKAKKGKLDAIIGREQEIYRVIQILNRRTKNNPCLIGEPGVGKTAIAEGIAQKIVEGDVPFTLTDKEVFLLDMTSLVAGTQFRGQFESRVKGLIDEVKAEGNIILFIDEIHTIVGTGDSEGSMSAANILKPALSRGEIQVIGATTFNEYRKHIEKDSALERRFQPVTVNEPNINDTIEILRGIKSYYEKHHKVKVSDDIIVKATTLSERYINDRFLPDKAIDLLDEACSCCSLRSKELAEYENLNKSLKSHYSELESLEAETENQDFEKIAYLKQESITIKDKLKELEPIVKEIAVDNDDLARVIELWTGIPAKKIKQDEMKKISDLEKNFKEKIIGQDEAVDLVVSAIKRNRVQLSKRVRPASFIFVGPTGVGKTELVKVLSGELFDSVEPLIRLDMSEFMEKHAVSRLIGSPPGYVGYDDAGQLTEKVRRKPYSVVLFDEIEKAHPDVMYILLQILDEGKVTDAHGRTVNFENTVIVMTSNAGSGDKGGVAGFSKTENLVVKEKAMKALSDILRPEFLGRVDEIVVFNKLSDEDLRKICALMLDELKEPLLEKGILFAYDDKALDYLTKQSNGGKYGARDLRKVIRKQVEDKIANLLVDNYEKQTKSILVSEKNNEIVLK